MAEALEGGGGRGQCGAHCGGRVGGYRAAGLHYTFNSRHCAELPKEAGMGEAALRVVDATHFGNAARFVNHACEANLECINVCAGQQGDTLMALLLRAVRDIHPGEELTLNYYGRRREDEKERIRALPSGPLPCRCGAPSCVRWLWVQLDDGDEASEEASPAATSAGAISVPATSCSEGPRAHPEEEEESTDPSFRCEEAEAQRAARKAADKLGREGLPLSPCRGRKHRRPRHRSRLESASTGTSRLRPHPPRGAASSDKEARRARKLAARQRRAAAARLHVAVPGSAPAAAAAGSAAGPAGVGVAPHEGGSAEALAGDGGGRGGGGERGGVGASGGGGAGAHAAAPPLVVAPLPLPRSIAVAAAGAGNPSHGIAGVLAAGAAGAAGAVASGAAGVVGAVSSVANAVAGVVDTVVGLAGGGAGLGLSGGHGQHRPAHGHGWGSHLGKRGTEGREEAAGGRAKKWRQPDVL